MQSHQALSAHPKRQGEQYLATVTIHGTQIKFWGSGMDWDLASVLDRCSGDLTLE